MPSPSPRSLLFPLLAALLGFAFTPLAAQERVEQKPLRVGVYDLAPYGAVNPDGSFAGASVDLWRRVAEPLGLHYEFVAEPQMEKLLEGVESGQYDVAVGAITITPERAAHLDFSYPAHHSGVAVALKRQSGLLGALTSYALVAIELSSLILMMLALLVLIGVAMWFIERPRRAPDEAEDSSVLTLRDGVYWAVVTMTTVGYGDKTPKTPIGRLIAIAWMLGSVALVSVLSASLVSRLTALQVEGGAGPSDADLSGKRLAAAAFSSGAEWLDAQRLAYAKYGSLQKALDALDTGEADAVVNSVGALRHMVAARFSKTLRVHPTLLAPAYMAFVLPEHSALKKPLDRTLMRITASPEWQAVEATYFLR
jgi:ABC-type amino acid transport substrate-binding protein